MCGICGIVKFDGGPVSERDVQAMNDTLQHRGPDDAGTFLKPGVGLGHRRLSIIDVAGGHQPLSNEDGSIWVLLNGEIYNYAQLRTELQGKGHIFATHSDTEAIVHLYEECGTACFTRLRGMFAVAIWDSHEKQLILARDRVGKKPLFYAASPERLVFGSELKALLAGNHLSRDVDQHAIWDYFSFGYIPAPKTIYRAVRKVLPGHYLVARKGHLQETKYWDLSFAEPEQRTEEQWCELLRHAVSEATRVRLMSEVPLGAFLSGGVDSSAVVGFMSRLSETPVTTCSIGFHEKDYDESGYARQIAEHFHTDHHEEIVRPSAVDIVNRLAWHYDEPFADSSAIPTYYVSRMARRHVTVALGGDGGDEHFAGYRRYLFDVAENRLRSWVPHSVRKPIFGPLGQMYPALAWAPRPLRAKATFQNLAFTPLEGYFNSVSIFRPSEKPRLFQAEFIRDLQGYDSLSVLQQYYDAADTTDPLTRIQYVDIKTYLTDDILTKVDRASMAVSLEVRAPLLDQELMELAARIPSNLKLRGRIGKYILKKAIAEMMPPQVLERRKQGFGVPLGQWFRRELKDFAHDAMFSKPNPIFNRDYLQRIWNEHQRQTFDRSAYLWSILMFHKWAEIFHA